MLPPLPSTPRGFRRDSRRPGFSLVELLTVVGIIALLIGILLPTMNASRIEAKRGATRAFLASCERGVEMFNTDFGQYPDSRRRLDPVEYTFDSGGDSPHLNGAHWLARAMVGHDTNGVDYGARSIDEQRSSGLKYDPDEHGGHIFRQKPPPPPVVYSQRRKAYVEKAAVKLDKDVQVIEASQPRYGRTVLLDTFEQPVLYYRAYPRMQVAFAETYDTNHNPLAVYTQEDNADLTGGKTYTSSSHFEGWIFRASAGKYHGMGEFGSVNPANFTIRASSDDRKGFTFTGTLHNASSMQTAKALKPVKETSFVLITAGPDGIYGTTDDVSNFK